jgi:hypothetical protein
MFDPKSAADINYIKGFDHGCDYIVAEIERHMRENDGTEVVLAPLLRKLKGTDNLGKVPTEKSE